jgi:thiol-disulfide isomerase/thioredoxin
LRGRVVLIDFWTYTCINCLRTLPYLEAWDRRYRDEGLTIVGVHSPEFSFEHDAGNVANAIKTNGIKYPVVQDNDLKTWDAWGNQYWPAEYLIDAKGNVRHISFGEGDYGLDEQLIRELLVQANPSVQLPSPTDVANTTPTSPSLTPETYLNYNQVSRYTGTALTHDAPASYRVAADIPADHISLGGTWTAGDSYFTAGAGAKLVLNFNAKDVYLVLAGHGTVTASVTGQPTRVIQVSGTPNEHAVLTSPSQHAGQLTLQLSPGLQAYDLTFG